MSNFQKLGEMATTLGNSYAQLHQMLIDRYKRRLNELDPALGYEMTLHLAHNWHVCSSSPSPTSKEIARLVHECDKRYGRLHARKNREWIRRQHKLHVEANELGRYFWCEQCKPYNDVYPRGY